MDKFGQVWISLDQFGQVWTNFDLRSQLTFRIDFHLLLNFGTAGLISELLVCSGSDVKTPCSKIRLAAIAKSVSIEFLLDTWFYSIDFYPSFKESQAWSLDLQLKRCWPLVAQRVTPDTTAMKFPSFLVKYFQSDTAENTIRDRDSTVLSAASSVCMFILLYCSSCCILPKK